MVMNKAWERYCVKPDSKVHLKDWDPEDKSAFDLTKKKALKELAVLDEQLDELQELLYAEHKHKILIILQAIDTAGKDGIIRHIFRGVNPQGVKVAAFKQPTPIELDHDYLWRIHPHVPANGEIAIFNRSHYEDVLVARVHELVSREVWKRRYDEINHFEEMLHAEGTTILKFFLHISKKEQEERLKSRLSDPKKHWKFSEADVKERKLWGEYMKAYKDAVEKTSTSWAPWYIIPSDSKWYRNLTVATILVKTLQSLKMEYPKSNKDLLKRIKI